MWVRRLPGLRPAMTQGLPAARGRLARTLAAPGDSGTTRGPVLLSRSRILVCLRIHVFPPQGHDLAAPAPGQHQQPQSRRRVHRDASLGLQRVQSSAEAAELFLRQEALKPARPVPGHEAAGVATRRDQPPRFRLIENARQSADRLVRRDGRHA